MSSFIGLDKPEKEKKKPIGLNDLFGIPDSQFEIVELPIQDLVPYKNHKFRPSSTAKRDIIAESIKEFGVLSPIIVRPKEDCAYEINGRYEILAGHQRTELSRQVGKTNIPAIIKKGLTEEEAEQIVDETNIQRSFEELTHTERAAVLSSHYNAMKKRNVRKEFLSEINSYLQTYANPLNIRAEGQVSHGETKGVRGVAEEYDLSKATIARYIRIDTLIDDLKLMLDDGEIAILPSVELSYISTENQELLAELINSNEYKCDINKAKLIRELQVKNKLTIATMTEVLSGKKVKRKPGAPKGYKVSGKVIQKYFKPEQDDKEIGEIIEKALELYFEGEGDNYGI